MSLGGKLIAIVLVLHQPVASTKLQKIQKGSYTGRGISRGKLVVIVLSLHQPVASAKLQTIPKESYTGGGVSRG